ncbi:transketolase [Lachnospiraceae bacterium]|nr:transketolase [Lachnospiraceae bacterium]
MRTTVIERLKELAKQDDRIALITGDSGYSVVETFIEKYPERCFNMGINEQATASIAAGMALEGYKVYVYGIGNFPTLRCLEQIRNDICYHNAEVTVLATGGGFAYGQLGMSHHATEEIAAMRPFEHMRIYMPADPKEAVCALNDSYAYHGPAYIRLGRGHDEKIYDPSVNIDVSKAISFFDASDINVFASGTILAEAVDAVQKLKNRGINIGLYSFPRVKPLDTDTIAKVAEKCKTIITLEEHSTIGGFGSAVAETVSAMQGARAQVIRLGLDDKFTSVVGSQAYLRDYYGISSSKIAACIEHIM